MFLRAERFDAPKAAIRLVNHFEGKLVLFGEDKLVKRITLDDLEEEDIEEIPCFLFFLDSCFAFCGVVVEEVLVFGAGRSFGFCFFTMELAPCNCSRCCSFC